MCRGKMEDTSKTYLYSVSLLVLFIFLFNNTLLCSGSDTMSSGQSLTSSHTLISKSGIFELGYFQPGNSPNYYIGIWYKKVSVQNKTVVWVGNRNTPVTDPSTSELKLLQDGNLVLLNQSKTVVWSTNSSSNSMNSSEAVLRDDGNLVLRDIVTQSDVFWQSFDFLTDTWLLGARLGNDNRTKKSQVITSWKSPNDPSEGLISLGMDPSGDQFAILWNRTQRYWSSGQWNGQNFGEIPNMRLDHLFNYSFVKNENESFFTYNLYNTSILTRQVLDWSGQIMQYRWAEDTESWLLFYTQPRQQCEVYAFCGTFGVCSQSQRGLPFCTCMDGFEPRNQEDWNLSNYSSGGCVRKTSLQCGERDTFSLMSNVKLPSTAQPLAVESADDCKLACWSNCSCSAYAYSSSSCSIWDGDLLGLQQLSDGVDSGVGLYLRLAASDIQKSGGKNKKTNTGVIVGAVAGIGAILVLVVFYIWRWRIRQSVGNSKTIEGSLVAFTYKDLENATQNFSEKLGGGGFGSVFKGVLPDSTAVAVKKLEGLAHQGEKQFRAEVSTIGIIHHVNLICLRGFCSEGDTRLLVYEYMPNGSLDYNLFRQQHPYMLNWKTRYQITLGIARGLSYLHEKCRDCIIHCDIKPENILLDADFSPKVADFGLAKLIGREFRRVLTTMRGTRGYLAPEWISGAPITVKADVYSYGMMLFEIVSGRRNLDHSDEGRFMFFPIWAARKITEDENVLGLLDYKLQGDANVEELTRACRVASWCIQDDESHRPSMGQVVQILEGVVEVKLPPIPRALEVLVENNENIHFLSEETFKQSSEVKDLVTDRKHHI